jgi:hypothetical protein
VPLRDAPELRYALTWRSADDNPAVRALALTAAELGPIML